MASLTAENLAKKEEMISTLSRRDRMKWLSNTIHSKVRIMVASRREDIPEFNSSAFTLVTTNMPRSFVHLLVSLSAVARHARMGAKSLYRCIQFR